VQWQMRLHFAFVQCNTSHWRDAEESLKLLDQDLELMDEQSFERLSHWTEYLRATIAQGTGDLDTALNIYQSGMFALTETPPTRLLSSENELSLLAALNSILIIRSPSHPSHFMASPLLVALESQTLHHRNKGLAAATYFLKSFMSSDTSISGPKADSILHRKQNLQQALTTSRSVQNSQIMAMAMNFMNTMFFHGIVGPQANKSLQTGYVLSKRLGNPLWQSVASGLWIETVEKEGGKEQQLKQLRDETTRTLAMLPERVQDAFATGS
jgi:Cohesin loading factor